MKSRSRRILRNLSGTIMKHVPYSGGAPAATGLVAGTIDVMFSSISNVIGHVQAGKLKVIAVSSTERNPLLPEIPTVAEAGVPGYSSTTWFGLEGPPRLSDRIVEKLNAAVLEASRDPAFVTAMKDAGFIIRTSTAAEMKKVVDDD